MPSRFVIALLAKVDDRRADDLRHALAARTTDLPTGESLDFWRHGDPIPTDAHAAAIVFGAASAEQDPATARAWRDAGATIFPVVDDLDRFRDQIPEPIRPFNGFELAPGDSAAELAGLVLESLGLQRGRRKVFISYARMDTAAVALQLREALIGRWYAAFHDLVSIRPGQPFQLQLTEQLADADALLLLNSENVVRRPFVLEEIAFAQKAGLGGVEVRWPTVQFRRESFLTPIDLEQDGRLADGKLTPSGLAAILDALAAERTRMQRDRERNVHDAVRTYAARQGLGLRIHPGRYVALLRPDGSLAARLDIALGLPTSLELATAWEAATDETTIRRVVYDPQGLTRNTLLHLAFLAERYPFTLLDYNFPELWQPIP